MYVNFYLVFSGSTIIGFSYHTKGSSFEDLLVEESTQYQNGPSFQWTFARKHDCCTRVGHCWDYDCCRVLSLYIVEFILLQLFWLWRPSIYFGQPVVILLQFHQVSSNSEIDFHSAMSQVRPQMFPCAVATVSVHSFPRKVCGIRRWPHCSWLSCYEVLLSPFVLSGIYHVVYLL